MTTNEAIDEIQGILPIGLEATIEEEVVSGMAVIVIAGQAAVKQRMPLNFAGFSYQPDGRWSSGRVGRDGSGVERVVTSLRKAKFRP